MASKSHLTVLGGFALYLLGSFILIALGLFNIVPRDYLGGIVIALFIGGLSYSLAGAIYQTKAMIEAERIKSSNLKHPAEREAEPRKQEEEQLVH
jgi:hypothetical protein